jgi:hypothetical protein
MGPEGELSGWFFSSVPEQVTPSSVIGALEKAVRMSM